MYTYNIYYFLLIHPYKTLHYLRHEKIANTTVFGSVIFTNSY